MQSSKGCVRLRGALKCVGMHLGGYHINRCFQSGLSHSENLNVTLIEYFRYMCLGRCATWLCVPFLYHRHIIWSKKGTQKVCDKENFVITVCLEHKTCFQVLCWISTLLHCTHMTAQSDLLNPAFVTE